MLAEDFADLPKVLKLRQPESGTFILKPVITYRVGGPLGELQSARYSLKITVTQTTVTLDFDLGKDVANGTYAPETEMPRIRAEFHDLAAAVARSVGGKLEGG